MRTNNRNTSKRIQFNGRPALLKSYDDTERFSCEQRYLAYFHRQGFQVPQIYEIHDATQEIVLEYIEGVVSERMDNRQLRLCIDILAAICNMQPLDSASQAARSYAQSFERALRELAFSLTGAIDEGRLVEYLESLQAQFRSTLFKDAKVSNWIFTDDGVAMIDFDYVRKSFFLADLAQLVNYQTEQHQPDIVVEYFLSLMKPQLGIPPNVAHDLFSLARANSYLAAVKHNARLAQNTQKEFRAKSAAILRGLKILK